MVKSKLTFLLILFFVLITNAEEKNLLSDGGMNVTEKWELKDGILSPSKTPGGIIWSKDKYSDFELILEYKTSKKCNSGVFFRTNPKNAVQGGFEIQIASNDIYSGKHIIGSLYDAKQAAERAGKADGEWNKMVITCKGPSIKVVLNGKETVNVNIDDWDTPKKNPDGSKNKFKTALKDLPKTGHIGFQYHGQAVWYKNVSIKVLK